MKRKLLQFEWCKYSDQFQVGSTFCIQKEDKEYPEYNPNHAHIWIDLFKWCIEITILDYR